MRLRAVAGIVLGLVMVACSADYVDESKATVLLLVTSINKGTPILSDVSKDGSIVNCVTDISVVARVKNPNNPGGPGDTVILQRYDVSFVRTDGRAVEGVDVPYRFSAAMTAQVAPGSEVTIPIDIVRHQAKLEPPLSNITGLDIVEMTVNVTVYGETISRQTVSGTGAGDVRFADYATGTTTCEGS